VVALRVIFQSRRSAERSADRYAPPSSSISSFQFTVNRPPKAVAPGSVSVDPFASSHGSLRTPKGMGDLLPPEAEQQRALARVVINCFERAGYDLIVTPLFEHADVVERGTDALDPRDLLRFVEPESGEVAVLRPDITPQIARAVATRMAQHPAPWRLCYEGRVIRRRRGRARSHQQITQAGVECVGLAGPEADVEVLELAADACEAAGLRDFRIELSHVSIAQSLLDTLPRALVAPMSEMLARKDGSALAKLAQTAQLPKDTTKQLCALAEQYGDLDMLESAKRELRWPAAKVAIASLFDLVERMDQPGTRARLGFDLSDARGSTYYTGMSFNVLAAGPGEPIGSGGRYDQLLARYGTSRPATGFALDLENLQWALRSAGARREEPRPFRVALGLGSAAALRALAHALRQRGIVAATLPLYSDTESCLAFARAWGYDAVLVLDRKRARLVRTCDAGERATANDPASIAALRSWAQEATKV
jgi:ATP phosphoribosyltransferase regulatory subunit